MKRERDFAKPSYVHPGDNNLVIIPFGNGMFKRKTINLIISEYIQKQRCANTQLFKMLNEKVYNDGKYFGINIFNCEIVRRKLVMY